MGKGSTVQKTASKFQEKKLLNVKLRTLNIPSPTVHEDSEILRTFRCARDTAENQSWMPVMFIAAL